MQLAGKSKTVKKHQNENFYKGGTPSSRRFASLVARLQRHSYRSFCFFLPPSPYLQSLIHYPRFFPNVVAK
jgi:hypothetical protein